MAPIKRGILEAKRDGLYPKLPIAQAAPQADTNPLYFASWMIISASFLVSPEVV